MENENETATIAEMKRIKLFEKSYSKSWRGHIRLEDRHNYQVANVLMYLSRWHCGRGKKQRSIKANCIHFFFGTEYFFSNSYLPLFYFLVFCDKSVDSRSIFFHVF